MKLFEKIDKMKIGSNPDDFIFDDFVKGYNNALDNVKKLLRYELNDCDKLKLIENSGGIDNLESEYQHNLE
jgi:hypothetical protein